MSHLDTVFQCYIVKGSLFVIIPQSVPNNTVYVDAVSFSLNYPLTTDGKSMFIS